MNKGLSTCFIERVAVHSLYALGASELLFTPICIHLLLICRLIREMIHKQKASQLPPLVSEYHLFYEFSCFLTKFSMCKFSTNSHIWCVKAVFVYGKFQTLLQFVTICYNSQILSTPPRSISLPVANPPTKSFPSSVSVCFGLLRNAQVPVIFPSRSCPRC